MKKLIILDLDNTLIYGTSNQNLPAKVLFRYSKYLTIYKRPFASQFVQKCHQKGDVLVYTTAIRDYAEKVCQYFHIKPVALFTREDCLIKNGMYVKSVPDYYFDVYDDITIIDDIPDIWDKKSRKKCKVVSVVPFIGLDDEELIKIEI